MLIVDEMHTVRAVGFFNECGKLTVNDGRHQIARGYLRVEFWICEAILALVEESVVVLLVAVRD